MIVLYLTLFLNGRKGRWCGVASLLFCIYQAFFSGKMPRVLPVDRWRRGVVSRTRSDVDRPGWCSRSCCCRYHASHLALHLARTFLRLRDTARIHSKSMATERQVNFAMRIILCRHIVANWQNSGLTACLVFKLAAFLTTWLTMIHRKLWR